MDNDLDLVDGYLAAALYQAMDVPADGDVIAAFNALPEERRATVRGEVYARAQARLAADQERRVQEAENARAEEDRRRWAEFGAQADAVLAAAGELDRDLAAASESRRRLATAAAEALRLYPGEPGALEPVDGAALHRLAECAALRVASGSTPASIERAIGAVLANVPRVTS